VWSAGWLAVGALVLLAAVGLRKAIRAFRAAAAALDWRVPEGALSMAMFGSDQAKVDVHRVPLAHVDRPSPRRVEPADRRDPSLAA
jgi:hypothetical protein